MSEAVASGFRFPDLTACGTLAVILVRWSFYIWGRQDLDWGGKSVPRAAASGAFPEGRSLPLAVLIL